MMLLFQHPSRSAIIEKNRQDGPDVGPAGLFSAEKGMNHFPSVELLEDTHQFPTHYMFKVIGKGDNGFIARAVALVREELHQEEDPPYSVRAPRSGRHVAVTLEPLVRDAEQVLSVYHRLVELEGLVLLW